MATETTKKKTSLQSLKPYPDFPLTAHPNGQWVKKIKGKQHKFGVLANPDAALQRYLATRDDLFLGRIPTPSRTAGELTLKRLCNHFLTDAEDRVRSNELTQKRWDSYKRSFRRLMDAVGEGMRVDAMGPDDFSRVKVHLVDFSTNPHTLGSEISRIKALFNHAYEQQLIDRPVRFGKAFKKPAKRVFAAHKQTQTPKLFTAEEVRAMLVVPDVMI